MPFNGSGVFSRLYSWAADAAGGIAISSSRMDAETDGIATGLSTCITKDGQTTTVAQIPFAQGVATSDGSAAAPAYTFTPDTNTGLYRIGSDNLGIAANGAKVLDIGTTGLGVTGNATVSGNATISGTLTVPGGITNSWVPISIIDFTSAVATADLPLPAGIKMIRLTGFIDTSAAASNPILRTSIDGGSSFSAGGTDYFVMEYLVNNGTFTGLAQASSSSMQLSGVQTNPHVNGVFTAVLFLGDGTLVPWLKSEWICVQSTIISGVSATFRNAAPKVNAIRIMSASGNMSSGHIIVEGF